MAQFRAKENCFLADGSYRKEGEVFEYSGPKHDSLEPVKGAAAAKAAPDEEKSLA